LNKIVLKSGRERSIINRHPWIFSGAVKQMPQADNGEIVQVVTNNDEHLGYGFFSPNSQITCRLFSFANVDEQIDFNFWRDKINNAYRLRKSVIDFENTNIFRLICAEGDFFPGLIVDVYNEVAVVQILIKGVERISSHIFKAINELGYHYIYLKTKQNTQLLEGVLGGNNWIDARPEHQVMATEHGVNFAVDVEHGQKTGFFIDQRENRKLVGQFSKGKKVLNTFCYSGGFSLYALEGGASLVHSVDSSKDAIQLCEQNVGIINRKDAHKSYVEDCFDFLKTCDDNYDIIILDPPAFAKTARAVDNAARGYKNLNLLGIKKVAPGGMIFTFSCSQHIDKDLFRKIVFSAAADAQRNVRIIKQLSQPEDHPINIYHPEGEYLKGLMLQVD
jgi:23S rRNA (cytosine1962-C5)-methyltransferase